MTPTTCEPERYESEMNGIDTVSLECPYCGEAIEIVVDGSVEFQEYTEDCPVCCRPMALTVRTAEEGIVVEARREDE